MSTELPAPPVEWRGGATGTGTGLAQIRSETPMPIADIRAIGDPETFRSQHQAHIVDLARFYAANGVELRGDGLHIPNASTKRKTAARVRDIRELRALTPDSPRIPVAAPITDAAIASQTSHDEALIALYSA